MWYFLAISFCVVAYVVWYWHEAKNAIELDDNGNPIPRWKSDLFDKEHDEAVKFRETDKKL